MKGFTIWFTGMPSAGKTTLATYLESMLLEQGFNVEVLDGDEVRTHLSKGLGFSREDRDTNVQRIGYVCHLLSRNGVIAISAAVSPYRDARRVNRERIGRFLEVYVKCPMPVLQERDVKGLYRMSREGTVKHLTGVDDPYEEPEHAEVVVETDRMSIEECVSVILRTAELLGYLPTSADGRQYRTDEEEKVKERLRSLGYIS